MLNNIPDKKALEFMISEGKIKGPLVLAHFSARSFSLKAAIEKCDGKAKAFAEEKKYDVAYCKFQTKLGSFDIRREYEFYTSI